MIDTTNSESRCVQYELEISIDAPPDRVWNAIVTETNAWWLPDFHIVDSESIVEFDINPGGRGLIEHRPDGSFLQWYVVQSYMPSQFKMYLVGNVAPDWGGPSTSNLSLMLTAKSGGCVLRVVDAHHGKVNDKYIESLHSGWNQLFGDGLRQYVENSIA